MLLTSSDSLQPEPLQPEPIDIESSPVLAKYRESLKKPEDLAVDRIVEAASQNLLPEKKDLRLAMRSPNFAAKVAPIIEQLGEKQQLAMDALSAERIAETDTRTLVDIVERFTKLGMLLAGLPTERRELTLSLASDEQLAKIIEAAGSPIHD